VESNILLKVIKIFFCKVMVVTLICKVLDARVWSLEKEVLATCLEEEYSSMSPVTEYRQSWRKQSWVEVYSGLEEVY